MWTLLGYVAVGVCLLFKSSICDHFSRAIIKIIF